MKNALFLFACLLLMGTTSLSAKTKNCDDLEKCVEFVSKLTGQKYFYDKPLKGKVFMTDNFDISEKNADKFLSDILYQNGYTRVPTFDNKIQIINARDMRYTPMPIYKANQDKLPDSSDYIMVSYKFKYPFRSTEFTRSFRPFMSRYGRIIDMKSQGTVMIQDSAKNVARMLKLVEEIDVDLDEQAMKKYQQSQKHQQELEKLKAKNCTYLQSEVEELKRIVKKTDI